MYTVDPDTHIDNLEQAEQSVLEGTSKWSCKIAITGIPTKTFLQKTTKEKNESTTYK